MDHATPRHESQPTPLSKAFARLRTLAPSQGFIRRITRSRYPVSVSRHDLELFDPKLLYSTTNLDILRGCLHVPAEMIIVLHRILELRRRKPGLVHDVVLLDHQTIHTSGHWCSLAFPELHSNQPRAIYADSVFRSDARQYTQNRWREIMPLLDNPHQPTFRQVAWPAQPDAQFCGPRALKAFNCFSRTEMHSSMECRMVSARPIFYEWNR